MKILTTALFSVFMLRRTQSPLKYALEALLYMSHDEQGIGQDFCTALAARLDDIAAASGGLYQGEERELAADLRSRLRSQEIPQDG